MCIRDSTSTSLQLFGKSFSGFGEGLNENLVKLLENAASTSAPTAPLKGELWMDTTTNQLKVYDGTSFKPTGGAKSSSSTPTNASAGDLWHDTTNDQLYVYTGSAFLNIATAGDSNGITLVGDDSTGTGVNIGETFKITGGRNIVSTVSDDTLTISSLDHIIVSEISATDSASINA